MVLNFKEIPQANGGGGMQDTFELFARDFFQNLGYEILQHPDRGADGKKDLIIQETRTGISGTNKIKWLVSCKHYAHSGRAVSDTDEPNILDRIHVHGCDGFIGFYSTLPAVSLGNNFEGLKNRILIQNFDREAIEKVLLESPDGIKLSSRYFPLSSEEYAIETPKPAKIFADNPSLHCEYCDNDLLEDRNGIFVILHRRHDPATNVRGRRIYAEAYFSCKGQCDYVLKSRYLQTGDFIDEWVDISDYLSPVGYIKKVMAWLNSINSGEQVERNAFEKLKMLLLSCFPHVSREQTSEEKRRIQEYLENGLSDYI